MARSNEKPQVPDERISELRRSLDVQDEKLDVDEEQARRLASEYVPGSPEEKALVRKLDWRLVVRA